ncbi:LexA/Signal peptidase [Atractiella rhizophila]|nr:LexA/Signal peptidase [Atractiella rhizophila]
MYPTLTTGHAILIVRPVLLRLLACLPSSSSTSSTCSTSSPSTSPTLTAKKSLISSLKNLSAFHRGQLVAYSLPLHPQGCGMKRIVGVEGDVIEYVPPSRLNPSMEDTIRILVPKSHLWLEGDSPSFSIDSRTFGPVPQSLVVGKAWAIVGTDGRRLEQEVKGRKAGGKVLDSIRLRKEGKEVEVEVIE